jgi:hypothetical protein
MRKFCTTLVVFVFFVSIQSMSYAQTNATEVRDFNVMLQEPGEPPYPSPAPGAVDVPFLGVELVTLELAANVESFLVDLLPGSTINPADITAVRLYVDDSVNGDDILTTTAIGGPNVDSAISEQPFGSFPASLPIGSGFTLILSTPQRFFLAMDFSPTADPNAIVGLTVNDITVEEDPLSLTTYTPDSIANDLDVPLPVALASFSATATNTGVTLHWRTETETNNIGFNIYRSTTQDGGFKKISFIDGHGSTAITHEYTFTDRKAAPGETYYYYLEDIDVEGKIEKSDLISITFQLRQLVPLKGLPARFALYQNYPNPFNPETWIPYDLAGDANVRLAIFNAQGHSVRRFDLGYQAAGSYLTRENAVYWDGRAENGESVSSGLYFYQLQTDSFTAVKRMVILK